MTFQTFRLSFRTPLHLSRGKSDTYESSATVLHSDKLKSALYVTAIQLFGSPPDSEIPMLKGEVEGEVKHIANIILKNLRLSSAFPYTKEGYWLPRPFSSTFKSETPQNKKELKSIQYLTVKQFETVAKGQEPTDLFDANDKARKPEVWEHETTQRVKINYGADSTPFYLEKLHAKKDTQLYFIAQLEGNVDEDFWTKFKAVLHLLGDNGMGLQRGLGNGQFSFKEDILELDLPATNAAWMALSLYHPLNQDEVKSVLENSYYQFTKRGGWISVPEDENHLSLRKKSVLFFTEGSVFPFEAQHQSFLCKGDAAIDLRPDYDGFTHPIWRDGRAIFLPLK